MTTAYGAGRKLGPQRSFTPMQLVRYAASIALALALLPVLACSNSESPVGDAGSAETSTGADAGGADAPADASDAGAGDAAVDDASTGDSSAADAGCTPANCVSPLMCCPSNGRCYNPACLACCM